MKRNSFTVHSCQTLFLVLSVFLAKVGMAAVLDVGVPGSGHPYSSIQSAINNSSSGDVVVVHPGTYTGLINYGGRAITVRSSDGAAVTTIRSDRSALGSVVTFSANEGASSILQGFTIENGYAGNGAGIYCDHASPTITNCIISGNDAFGSGGGIYCGYSLATITNCIFKNNHASSGGGIYVISLPPFASITNCLFINNSGRGAGVYSTGSKITNCTFSGNYGTGAYFCYGGGSTENFITNSVLWGDSSSPEIEDLCSYLTVEYSIIQGWTTAGTNINEDPLFFGGGNYHLQSGSPGINGGDNAAVPTTVTTDLDGNPRIRSLTVDIGSYEGVFAALGRADFDGDGLTDLAAFHLPSDQFFAGYADNLGQYGWGGADCYPLIWDANGDGRTEISIYHIPTNQWFFKGQPGDNLGQFGWDQEDCIPLIVDMDGNGAKERAFYHTPSNTFFFNVQGGTPTQIQFGWNGPECIPVPADYDGDGKTDLMIYHVPSNQWLMHGVGNLGKFGWGGANSIPMPADWNGDGKIEIGVVYMPDNEWIWRDAGANAHFMGQYGWGGSASFPIPGDYNGDGTVERAFYRHAQNRWFIEGKPELEWGYDGGNFMPITSQTAVFNWFRFVLGRF